MLWFMAAEVSVGASFVPLPRPMVRSWWTHVEDRSSSLNSNEEAVTVSVSCQLDTASNHLRNDSMGLRVCLWRDCHDG